MSDLGPSSQGWHHLEPVDVERFVDARLQLHWAAQVLGAIGDAHIEKMEDDGQSNFGWVDGMQLLAGRYLENGPTGFFSMTPNAFLISFHEPGGDTLDHFQLAGQDLPALIEWAESVIESRVGLAKKKLVLRDYEMPPHAVADGRAFEAPAPDVLEFLHRCCHDANLILRDLRSADRSVTAPRLWPHHFDEGAVKFFDASGPREERRALGLGLCLGDPRNPLPYWYVAPWPIPSSVPDVVLPTGAVWTTEDFMGAKLSTAALKGDGAAQERRVREFFDAAIGACTPS